MTVSPASASDVFELASEHEQVVFAHDAATGLRAIIAIHSTALGPALGGTRFHPYPSTADALRDVLDLSRGMSYKAALAGLRTLAAASRHHRGPASDQDRGTAAGLRQARRLAGWPLLHRLRRRHLLGRHGRHRPRECDFVTGRTTAHGGAGDSSVLTAYGVFQGMRAAASFRWGSDSLSGRTVGVAGVGKVGRHLVRHLVEDGARVVVTDVHAPSVAAVLTEFPGVTAVESTEALVGSPLDVYAPCALGGAITDEVVEVLSAGIVCGAANDQLAHPGIEKALEDAGILYAPDYCVNAGGLIQVADELDPSGFSFERAQQRATRIYDTTREVLGAGRRGRVPPRSLQTGSPSAGCGTWVACGACGCPADAWTDVLRPARRPASHARLLNSSVARAICVIHPVVLIVGLVGLRGDTCVTAVAVQLSCQRPEVRLMSAVLQVAGDLRLLCLRSAAGP